MKLTRLMISGVVFPQRSDTDVSLSIEPIAEASDLRRTVNGNLTNVARSAFRRVSIRLSGSDMHLPAFSHLNTGDYVELVPFERIAFSLPLPSAVATLPRAGVDIVGLTQSGEKIQGPAAALAWGTTPLPLQQFFDPLRAAQLCQPVNVVFSQQVIALRYRPVYPCLVSRWSVSSEERLADDAWTLELEEV